MAKRLTQDQKLLRLFNKVYQIEIGTFNNPPKVYYDKDLSTPEDETRIGRCVYKLQYGDKYIIWYGASTLWGSYFHFKRGFTKRNPSLPDYHQKMYDYMASFPDKRFKVEVLFETQDEKSLLRCQQYFIDLALIFQCDENCLNTHSEAYLPKHKNKSFGSFNFYKGTAFKRWLSSERYLRVTRELVSEYRNLLKPALAMSESDSVSQK